MKQMPPDMDIILTNMNVKCIVDHTFCKVVRQQI